MAGLGSLLVLLASLSAGAEPQKPKTKVVVLDINVIDTSAPGEAANAMKRLGQIAGEQVAAELANTGKFNVIGTSDLNTMLGLERQKQLLGCGEEANSCYAELSDALGAPLVVAGTLARAGGKMRLDLKLVRARDANVLSRQGAVLVDEGDVFTVVPPLAKALAAAGVASENPAGAEAASTPAAADAGSQAPVAATSSEPVAPTVVAPAKHGSRSVAALVLAGVGVAAAIAGGAVLIDQSLATSSLTTEIRTLHVEDALQRLGTIDTERTMGPVLLGVGAAAAAGGLLWFFLSGGDPKASASLTPVHQGALLTWSGTW